MDTAILDLTAIEARHARYRCLDEQETYHTSPLLVVAAIASAEDVPTLLERVRHTEAELAQIRAILAAALPTAGAGDTAADLAQQVVAEVERLRQTRGRSGAQ